MHEKRSCSLPCLYASVQVSCALRLWPLHSLCFCTVPSNNAGQRNTETVHCSFRHTQDFPDWFALQVLTDHTDEVWHVAFSHDGTMLASASKDKTAIIWQVQRQEQTLAKKFTLSGHSESIAYLAWSPDDTMLATCGNDNVLRVWNTHSGQCLKEMTHHSKEVSSVAWLPDSECTGAAIAHCMLLYLLYCLRHLSSASVVCSPARAVDCDGLQKKAILLDQPCITIC